MDPVDMDPLELAAEQDRSTVASELRRAVAIIQRWSQRTMHRRTGTELSPNETHLLTHLAASAPQRMGTLADWQGVDRSTMTMQIGSLVDRGLAQRTPDPADRRATIIELTDHGTQTLEDYAGRASGILSDALEGWSDAQLGHFSRDLGRFADDLQAALANNSAGH